MLPFPLECLSLKHFWRIAYLLTYHSIFWLLEFADKKKWIYKTSWSCWNAIQQISWYQTYHIEVGDFHKLCKPLPPFDSNVRFWGPYKILIFFLFFYFPKNLFERCIFGKVLNCFFIIISSIANKHKKLKFPNKQKDREVSPCKGFAIKREHSSNSKMITRRRESNFMAAHFCCHQSCSCYYCAFIKFVEKDTFMAAFTYIQIIL